MMPPAITHIPLQLDQFFLTSFKVDWRPLPGDGEYKTSGLLLDVSYDLAIHADNPHAYQMTLSVAGEDQIDNAPGCGYKFDCVIVGRYRLEDAKPEMEPRLARVNGVSLLYSTLRGVIGMVTGTFEQQKLELPSIDPKAVMETVERRRAQGSSSTPPIPETQPETAKSAN